MMISGIPGYIGPEVFAMTIPLLSIFGGVTIAIVAIIMSGRKKELIHKERLLAMEKGIDVPVLERKQEKEPGYIASRKTGLIMLSLGLALTFALWAVAGKDGGVWGLIPLAIGIGLMVAAHLEQKDFERRRELKERETSL